MKKITIVLSTVAVLSFLSIMTVRAVVDDNVGKILSYHRSVETKNEKSSSPYKSSKSYKVSNEGRNVGPNQYMNDSNTDNNLDKNKNGVNDTYNDKRLSKVKRDNNVANTGTNNNKTNTRTNNNNKANNDQIAEESIPVTVPSKDTGGKATSPNGYSDVADNSNSGDNFQKPASNESKPSVGIRNLDIKFGNFVTEEAVFAMPAPQWPVEETNVENQYSEVNYTSEATNRTQTSTNYTSVSYESYNGKKVKTNNGRHLGHY